jgi:hypothetical protein
MGRMTLEALARESCYGKRSLQRYFTRYLAQTPVMELKRGERVNLMIDGTYFANGLCLILYRDDRVKYTQLYRLSDGEWFEEIKEDLENLLLLGIEIESITCDGHRSILKAIRQVCPEVILQRCLIHVQRMCLLWLTQWPKSKAGQELRIIVRRMHTIEQEAEKQKWLITLIRWHEQHQTFLNEKSISAKSGRYWFKHKLLRRSFSTIRNALPNLFQYIANGNIPKCTNGLESFFGHLKGHLKIHRGLSKSHHRQFIQWYLFLHNRR